MLGERLVVLGDSTTHIYGFSVRKGRGVVSLAVMNVICEVVKRDHHQHKLLWFGLLLLIKTLNTMDVVALGSQSSVVRDGKDGRHCISIFLYFFQAYAFISTDRLRSSRGRWQDMHIGVSH